MDMLSASKSSNPFSFLFPPSYTYPVSSTPPPIISSTTASLSVQLNFCPPSSSSHLFLPLFHHSSSQRCLLSVSSWASFQVFWMRDLTCYFVVSKMSIEFHFMVFQGFILCHIVFLNPQTATWHL